MSWVKEAFGRPEKKPKDWFSIADIAKITGNPESTVYGRLSKMLKNGEVEMKIFLDNGKKIKCYSKKNTKPDDKRRNTKAISKK